MANLRRWSSSASGNSSIAGGVNTINFAEGQAPGSVNNSAREMMAQIRSIYAPEEWGWVEHSATASIASQTTFKLTGNQTSNWSANRRVRLKSGSTTRLATIVSSSFTTETTITLTVDSGSLSASHSLAALSVITTDHVPPVYANLAAVQASISQAVSIAMPTGAIIPYAGATAPTDFLFCFGQAVSRTTYAALFTVISTTYGAGDGSTTFNLPDLRGRVIAGQDDMGGSSANRLTGLSGGVDGDVLGGTGGSESHTITEAQMPLHGHPFRASYSSQATASSTTTGGFMTNTGSASTEAAHTGVPANTQGQQIGGTGGGAAHNNVQPTIILNYIIHI